MLPLHQAKELKASITAYFDATYTFRNRSLKSAFEAFIDHPEEGMFKGPYLSVKLPFVKAESDREVPLEVFNFTPYDHQLRAWRRLTTREGHRPEGTILTTGTGSGKTEAFLFPLLDYCYRRRAHPGIKAIVLYPMNALATDQAARFAEAIAQNDTVKDAGLTVGLLIGNGKSDDGKSRATTMGRHHVIEDRDTILKSPPNILLTNFKMLDYALMRANYQQLWSRNTADPELLKFLVLDELHTYDGAQGSDVANLIRRLKLKFGLERGKLCPVGTSATVGDGDAGKAQLLGYAGRVFGEAFTDGAIIGEKREAVDTFFRIAPGPVLPSVLEPKRLQFSTDDSFGDYVKRQREIWNIPEDYSAREVGDWCRRSLLLKLIIASCVRAPTALTDVAREVARREEQFDRLPINVQCDLIRSLLSIADESKNYQGNALFSIQVQKWIRELSGLVREVSTEPAFRWRKPGTPSADDGIHALPMWHCRVCHGSGWVSRKPDTQRIFLGDDGKIFEAYFSRDKNTWFLVPDTEDHLPAPDYQFSESLSGWLDPVTLTLHDKETETGVRVRAYRKFSEHKADFTCPLCNDPSNSVSIVGGRTATMASVATGQVLATELDGTPEKKRKLLAFTNSVQDAAHQAGFISARNYRFTFRTAILNAIRDERRTLPLNRLFDAFRYFWRGVLRKQHPEESEAAYVAQFFPAKKVGRVDPADYRDDRGRFKQRFLDELDAAISWEATSEFGLYSTIGRTLERTLSCAVWINPAKIDAVHGHMLAWLNDNAMPDVTPRQMRDLVKGLLLRQRQRGAVSHPFLEKYRTEGATQWNLNYTSDQRHFLNPTYGGSGRFPRPIVTGRLHKKDSPLDTTYTSKDNWYHAWLRRNFPMATTDAEAINDFYRQLFPTLAEVGLMDIRQGPEGDNYCLLPEVLQIGADAGAMECGNCNARQTIPLTAEPDLLTGMPCITYRCTGHYTPVASEPNYYQSVYRRRRAPRIYATDHTGLFDRGDRERKEIDFKTRPRVDSLNALVATSTLEMGIDIGDLNITMNTTVPPLPANFLQRIGRAGRKSGAALIVNFAKGHKSHDLFYYEVPEEMMAGRVHTPGCFLSAREIMKRHFLAYVIDNWTATDPATNRIPPLLQLVKLRPDLYKDATWFPNRLRDYLAKYGEDLLTTFRAGYSADEIDPETFADLTTYQNSGRLSERILACFRRLTEELEKLRAHGRFVKEEIDSGKYGQSDPLFKTYLRELKGLRAAIRKLEKRQTIEQMTNYGLLPNYAFPETGVTMNAQITTLRRREGQDAVFETVEVEAVRPASSGLRDLTPGNVFYTQGWQLPVTGVNTADYDDTTQEWVFCSNCDHLEPALGSSGGFCPKCNDPSFSSPENRHLVMELREVKATARRDDATIRDNKEERDRGKQNITTHFDFSEAQSQGAFALVDIPFGAEYVKMVGFRQINAGHKLHRETGRQVTIADKKVNASGYITCPHCGKSTTHQRKEENRSQVKEPSDYHYPYCRHKGHGYSGEGNELLKELFFVREMTTEVIKLLLPVQEFEREEHIQMFLAGINLGLRHFYGGNPQHIGLRGYSEFNRRTNRFDVYLILQDTTPGGTGYLSKLFSRENITLLLKLAYEQIKTCSCQERGMDGCYHCVFSYGTQHFHHELSRAATERLFREILDKCRDWVDVPGGLSTIGNTSNIEESELERRFVRLFRTLAKRVDSGWAFRELNHDGVLEYECTYEGEGCRYVYQLRPQIALGYAQNIRVATRADFVLQLVADEEQGKILGEQEVMARPRVPCYLDGWAYHATRENPRFATDIGGRVAILQSGRYASWSLTYDDVVMAEKELGFEVKKNQSISFDELAGALQVKAHRDVAAFLGKTPGKGGKQENFLSLDTSFGRLRWWLERGLHLPAMEDACHATLSALQSDLKANNFAPRTVASLISGKARRNALPPLQKPARDAYAWLDGLPPFTADRQELEVYSGLLERKLAYRYVLDPLDGEGYEKASWNLFWRLFNVLQFAAVGVPTYQIIGEGVAATVNLQYFPTASEQTTSVGPTVDTTPLAAEGSDLLAVALEFYDPPFRQIAQEAVAAGKLEVAELEGSFILLSDREEVLAEAVLGSHSGRAVTGVRDPKDAAVFTDHGFTVHPADQFTIDLL